MTDPAGPARAGAGAVTIVPADPSEYQAIGRLTLGAYRDAGVLTGNDGYAAVLADAGGRAAKASLFAAHDGTGRLVGTVTTAHAGHPYADVAEPGELEFRMLAVDPAARGHGIGTALVDHCEQQARDAGEHSLVISVIETNTGALAMYDRLRFVRRPERDRRTPSGELSLLVLTRAIGNGRGPRPRG